MITWQDHEDLSDKVLVSGMRVGPLLFASGNAAYDVEEQDFERQLENTLTHQIKTLSRGGSDLEHVFKLDVYLNHPQQHTPTALSLIRRHFPAGRLAVTITHTREQPQPYFLVSLVSTALARQEGTNPVEVRTIRPTGWADHDLPYAQAVQVGDLIFVSGQMGVDPRTGALVEGGIASQTRQALRNTAEILSAAGSSLAKVVRGTVYAVYVQRDVAELNQEFKAAFRPNPPARAIVGVSELPEPGALVQFDFIATI